MNGLGYYRMHRGWMDNPMFKPEPYTEREAWVWLIENAAWKDGRKRVGPCTVEVKRGQVAASLRFMACAWKWNEPKVRRFLSKLREERAIDAASDAGVNVVSICNYERYQADGAECDAADDAGTQPTQQTTQQTTQGLTEQVSVIVDEMKEVAKNLTQQMTQQMTQTIRNKKEEDISAPDGAEPAKKGKKAKEPKAPKTVGYTDEENAAFRRIEAAYPERSGGQKPNMAKGYCRKIVRNGEASWEALALAAAMYRREEEKNGNVGTNFIGEIQNFFVENGKYQSYLSKANQNMDKLRPAHIQALERFRESGDWPAHLGGKPWTSECRVPTPLIREILGQQPTARPVLALVNA